MDQNARHVLRTTCAAHGLIHVLELSVPPLLVLIQGELGASDFRMGQVVAAYGLLFGLGALPAGLLVDRIGSSRLLAACLWGASVAVLGMALAPGLPAFAVCATLMGLCLSAYHPAGTSLITHAMPPSGRVFALHGMAGNFGVATSSVIAGTLGALFGWRWALGVLAVPGVLLGLRALSLPAPTVDPSEQRHTNGRWGRLLLLLVAAGFMGMVYRGLTTFLPKLFSTTYAQDPQTGTALGGALTTAALLVGIAGMYVAGRAMDRGVHPATVFLVGSVLQAPLLLAMGSFGATPLVPLAMGVAFFHFFTQPPGNHLVFDLTPPHARGLGYGLYFFLAFGAGSTGAGLSGYVSDRLGLSYIFPVLATLLLVPALAMLSLRRTKPSATQPTPDASSSASVVPGLGHGPRPR